MDNSTVTHLVSETPSLQVEDYKKAILELKRYFTSGNNIPVDRAVIKTEDFERITKGLV